MTATTYRSGNTPPIPPRVAERAGTRYVVAVSGCWISTYSVASHGYAQIGWQDPGRGRAVMTTAHRAAWVHANGMQIPEGQTIDHICRNRPCVRPDHLRLLSNMDNATDNGMASRKTRIEIDRKCRRCDHALVQGVTGRASCRECSNEARRRRRHERGLLGLPRGG